MPSRPCSASELPPKGTVLAPDHALCDECPRKDTRPEKLKLERFKRVHEMRARPGDLPAGARRGLPGTGDARRVRGAVHPRKHAVHRLFRPHQPRARLRRQGLSAIASVIDGNDESEIDRVMRRASRIRSGRFTAIACRPLCWAGGEWSDAHGSNVPRQDHHRSDHPARRPRQNRDLPGRARRRWSAPTSRCRSCGASRSSRRAGRPRDMPQITSRICGVCPTAHHMASTKALDALYQVTPPPAARKIRELVYSHLHGGGPRAAFLLPGRPGFRGRTQGAGGRAQRAGRHRQGGRRDRRRK